MALTIQQMKVAHDAFLQAFPTSGELEMVLLWEGYVYADLTAKTTRTSEYLNIIKQLNGDGTAKRVIIATHLQKPENAALKALVAELEDVGLPDTATPPTQISPEAETAADEADQKTQKALQRTVNAGELDVDTAKMLNRLSRLSCQVGAVEIGSNHLGTCFLIGPDLVLTNHHVIASVLNNNLSGGQVRFDRFVDENDIPQTGFTVPFHQDWHIFGTPHDPADTTQNPNDVPAPDNLDFAVVRLAEQVSERPCLNNAAATPRGWAKLPDVAQPDVPIGNTVLIIQYPLGAPQKTSPGRVLSYGGNALRVRYSANTKSGSSGSPVTNGQGQLIALHHAGDPNFDQLAEYNQGIPLKLIAGALAANGHPKVLA